MISPRDLTAVILAGGKAQKHGGLVPSVQNVDGKLVIERQAAVLKPKVSRIEVSVSVAVAWSRFPSVVDQFESVGPLAGIATALKNASTDYVLIVGGAFAWLQPDVLDLLVARSGEPFDAVAFRFNFTNPNPLFAIYHRRCAQRAIDRLERGERDAQGLLTSESLAVRWIEDYELQSFDPDILTFKEVKAEGPGPTPVVAEPTVNPNPPTQPNTVPVPFDPGDGGRFAFQSTQAYQSALAFVPVALQIAAAVSIEEQRHELRRAALALPIAIATGTAPHNAAYACVALLDTLRATQVKDARIADAELLLATLVKQL